MARQIVAKKPHGGESALYVSHECARRMDSAKEPGHGWAEAPARSSGADGDGDDAPSESESESESVDARDHC
jgi:hypothetical protein